MIHKHLFWEYKHGERNKGRPWTRYTDTLEKDTGITREHLPSVMDNRNRWRQIVEDARICLNG